LWSRGHTYAFDRWGGLARPAPVFAACLGIAAFGSLGLPGFSGFIAEFQVFTGALPATPVATGIAVLGILVTAGLFLLALQRLLTGETVAPDEAVPDPYADPGEERPARVRAGGGTAVATEARRATRLRDLHGHEVVAIVPLLALAVVLGLFPRVLLGVLEPAAMAVVDLVAR
jgi:NADH-quinone oxidoreductase subunit M